MKNKTKNPFVFFAILSAVALMVALLALAELLKTRYDKTETLPYAQYQNIPLINTVPAQYLIYPNSPLLRLLNYRVHITVLKVNNKGMIDLIQGTLVDQDRRGVAMVLPGYAQVFDREMSSEVMTFKLGYDWRLSNTSTDPKHRKAIQELVIFGAATQVKSGQLPVYALTRLEPELQRAVLEKLTADIAAGGKNIPAGNPMPARATTPKEAI